MSFSKKILWVATMICSGAILYFILRKKKEEEMPEEVTEPKYCVFYSESSRTYYCGYVTYYEKDRLANAVACYSTYAECKKDAERRTLAIMPEPRTPTPKEPYPVTSYYRIAKSYPHVVYIYSDASFTKESGLPIPYITNLGDGAEALENLKNGKKRFIIELGTHYEGGQVYTLVRDWRVLREDNQFWYCEVLLNKVKYVVV